jgi:RimJ/RimL family protein N-acetyltransferase
MKLTFKPAVEAQRPLIHRWLEQDYIREWIHGIGLQSTITGLKLFLEFQSEGKGLERDSDITQHWVGYDGDHPIVYLLTSNILKNEDDDYAKYCESDGLAITLDIFIIDPNYVGKGFGTQIIREFLTQHFSDVSEVLIDPEKRNTRAAHAYQKAGFKILGEFIAPWHPVPHYIMKLKMSDLIQKK